MDCEPSAPTPTPITLEPTTPTPSPTTLKPTTKPTSSPTTLEPTPPEEVCQRELDAVGACTALLGACFTCVMDAYNAISDEIASASCSAFAAGICPAIAEECNCGTCNQSIENVSAYFLIYFCGYFIVYSDIKRMICWHIFDQYIR
jgi:hypothetical protein